MKIVIVYKPQAIPAIVYFAVSIFELLSVFTAPTGASLSGVWIAVLTAPWSLIGVAILDSLRILGGMIRVVLSVIFIGINTYILMVICGYFKKRLFRVFRG